MKKIVLAGFLSVFLMTACKKDDAVAEKSLEAQNWNSRQDNLK
jgi:hypothetical protein